MKAAGRYAESFEELPDEYKVSDKIPKPLILQYALPAPTAKVVEYAKWCEKAGELGPNETVTDVLSDHCLYRIRLGRPVFKTRELGHIFEVYNNYRKPSQRPTAEKEEEIPMILRTELELPEDVKPRWFFHPEDPRLPPMPLR